MEEGEKGSGRGYYDSLPSLVHFGTFVLSASGRKLLYVAEREKPKASSFFKKPSG